MTKLILSRRTIIMTFCGVLLLATFALTSTAQKRPPKRMTVCGNPKTCASLTSQPYDLGFRMPRNAVISDSELFYVVMLKSIPSPSDDCDKFVPETDRLAAQELFPNNKVFTSRCLLPGYYSYSNTNPNTQFMAVYAGRTQAEANRMLAAVKATGKFPGANVRRIRATMNGT